MADVKKPVSNWNWKTRDARLGAAELAVSGGVDPDRAQGVPAHPPTGLADLEHQRIGGHERMRACVQRPGPAWPKPPPAAPCRRRVRLRRGPRRSVARSGRPSRRTASQGDGRATNTVPSVEPPKGGSFGALFGYPGSPYATMYL